MSLSDKQKQINYAKENGFHCLGACDIDVEYPLTADEKINLGKTQSEYLIEIEKLQSECDKIKREYKNKVEAMSTIVSRSSEILKRGSKIINEKLPCFLDPKKNKKHFVNLSTGEIVESREATESDRQGSFLED